MKKETVLGILFFSGIWGISEAVLGGLLYRASVPYASVALTIIAFVVLTFAKVYFPQKGIATIIAVFAMLYKFMNAPFFACHMFGILLTGVCYDLFFSVFKIKNKSICAAAAVYLNYIVFALMMTYLFRYEYWAQAGLIKVLSYIGIGGSIAALGVAVFVPLSFRFGKKLKAKYGMPFGLQLKLAAGGISVATLLIWMFGLAVLFLNM
ncbi:MAG: hypothetical protein ACYS18_02710 [Planctomycetota bacterium]|jgi:hypothetical protein